MQLEDAHASIWCGAVVDRQRVGGTANHLAFNQQGLVSQNQQGSSLTNTPDRQLLALRQVHTLHLVKPEHLVCYYRVSAVIV